LIAPAIVFGDPAGGAPAPMALVNAACDGDVTDQIGQIFFEGARAGAVAKKLGNLRLARTRQITTKFKHDAAGRSLWHAPDAPTATTCSTPTRSAPFLASYAGDFLTAVFSSDPAQMRAAALERMGIDAAAQAGGHALRRGCAGRAAGRHPPSPCRC
jgi:hypothetical protein